jgi:hypothetical protein
VGVFPPEEWFGAQFRWSEPVAILETSLAPGKYRLELQWLPLRRVDNMAVFVDQTPIPITQTAKRISSVSAPGAHVLVASGFFQVEVAGPVQISWTCEPWKPPRDSRLLGLPVSSVAWSPADGEAAPTQYAWDAP